MKKIIKKIGNSLGIIFDREDCKIYELKEGDIIDFDDTLVKFLPEGGLQITQGMKKEVYNKLEKQAKELGMTVEELTRRRIVEYCKNMIRKKK